MNSETALPFHRSHALVVGIDTYTNGVPPLQTAVHDAEVIAERLVGRHGFELSGPGEASSLLCNADATRERLLTIVREEWLRCVGPDDRVLVYFAGHGVSVPSAEGPAGYLL